MTSKIDVSLFKLKQFIEKENYRGYDPYDALSSPVFKLPILKSNYTLRFLAQQFIKRFPFNLRPVLGIKKGMNPVTLGLCINGYVNLMNSDHENAGAYDTTCLKLIGMLEKQIPGDYHGACWGYDFPWQSRHFSLKAFEPTVVASGIISNALFEYYTQTKNKKVADLCRSVCNFIISDLNHIVKGPDMVCISYSPYDEYCVYNAAMKGVRSLSQAYSITKENMLLELATQIVNYVVSKQNNDGSWYYADADSGKWIDNYHTGYILDCLNEYMHYSQNFNYKEQYNKGLKFYLDNFITKEGIPKFYNNATYPVDCTAAAQTILTLCKNNEPDKAVKVADYMINNMQDENGSFYFRSTSIQTNKSSFMRWSDAWMFYALSTLSHFLNSTNQRTDY